MPLVAQFQKITGVPLRAQAPLLAVMFGHGATHWMGTAFYMLLPWIKDDLSLNYLAVGSLVALTHFSSFLANLGSGVLVDVTGRRVLIQCGALILGSLALGATAVVENVVQLAVLVSIISASGLIWHPAAIPFLSELYPKNRGYALSAHSLGANLGDFCSPLALGLLLGWFSWQFSAFLIAVPVAGVVLLLWWTLNNHSENGVSANAEKRRLGTYWTSLKQLGRHRTLLGLCLASGFYGSAQTGLLMFIPIYLADRLQTSPLMTGFGFAALQFGGIIAAPVAGVTSDRIGRKPVMLFSLLGTTILVAGLAGASGTVEFVGLVLLLGFLLFAIRPVVQSWCMDLAPESMGGTAISLLFGFKSVFSIGTPLFCGAIADLWGIREVFWCLTLVAFVATALAFILPATEHVKA
tara:strand:- start:381 stop:1607 length:1227 start_codon:yes stop_codon:yes gene_type:complete